MIAFRKADVHCRLSLGVGMIGEYQFEICRLAGKKNVIPDYVLRSIGLRTDDASGFGLNSEYFLTGAQPYKIACAKIGE